MMLQKKIAEKKDIHSMIEENTNNYPSIQMYIIILINFIVT